MILRGRRGARLHGTPHRSFDFPCSSAFGRTFGVRAERQPASASRWPASGAGNAGTANATAANAIAYAARATAAGWRGRWASRAACGPEIARLCPGVPPGGGRIVQCLMSRRGASVANVSAPTLASRGGGRMGGLPPGYGPPPPPGYGPPPPWAYASTITRCAPAAGLRPTPAIKAMHYLLQQGLRTATAI